VTVPSSALGDDERNHPEQPNRPLLTSWSRETDERWNALRAAVLAGTDAEQAARGGGLAPLGASR
jgi:hypothetical protein